MRPARVPLCAARSIIAGISAWVSASSASTSMRSVSRWRAKSTSVKRPTAPTPALLITRSQPAALAARTTASTPSSVARSAVTVRARLPNSASSAASFSGSRPVRTRSVVAGNARANASPRPPVAPVTSAARGAGRSGRSLSLRRSCIMGRVSSVGPVGVEVFHRAAVTNAKRAARGAARRILSQPAGGSARGSLSAGRSAYIRAWASRCRAGADGRCAAPDPRPSPSTGRSSRRCGRARKAP